MMTVSGRVKRILAIRCESNEAIAMIIACMIAMSQSLRPSGGLQCSAITENGRRSNSAPIASYADLTTSSIESVNCCSEWNVSVVVESVELIESPLRSKLSSRMASFMLLYIRIEYLTEKI